tara:strand:- start:102 stop:821 length:720 start_codon:yes stop_codon:yes gene_type:complete
MLIFEKGRESGFAILIPVYNIYLLTRITEKPWWWTILLLVPILNIYFGIRIIHSLSVSFGKGWTTTLGLVLLPVVFLPILAFNSNNYIGKNKPDININNYSTNKSKIIYLTLLVAISLTLTYFSIFFISISFIIIYICSRCIVMEKGRENGFGAIIPIYNIYLLTRITEKPWWWTILLLVPILNIYIGVLISHSLSESFGKSWGFTLGLILLPVVFFPILAFDNSAIYKGNNCHNHSRY